MLQSISNKSMNTGSAQIWLDGWEKKRIQCRVNKEGGVDLEGAKRVNMVKNNCINFSANNNEGKFES